MRSNYARHFLIFFRKAVKTVGLSNSFYASSYSHDDLVNNAIRKFENHLSVKKIVTIPSGVDKAVVEKSIGNLNSSKLA